MLVLFVVSVVSLVLLQSGGAARVERSADKVVELVSAISAIVLVLGEVARRIRRRIRARRAYRHLTTSERPTDPRDIL